MLFALSFRGLKRVAVTGASGGLGEAISAKFRDADWDVLSPGRENLDVTDGGGVERFFAANPCDLLVCAAGITHDKPLARYDPKAWDAVWAVNYCGAEICATAALPGMVSRGGGHIVFVSSYAALHPEIGQSAYASAKAALFGLTKSLAASHGEAGVRVNAVLPGFLETPMTSAVSPARKADVRKAHVLNRYNTAASVAGFLRFLEDELPHTSGQIFQLDSRL